MNSALGLDFGRISLTCPFVALAQIADSRAVLDVGCGPATLSKADEETVATNRPTG